MRKFMVSVVLLLAAVTTVGCSNDRTVSIVTRDCATTLTIVSQDLDRDAGLYLDSFRKEALSSLDSLERLTLEALARDNKLNDTTRAQTKATFDAKRQKLDANIVAARKKYDIRASILRNVASNLIEIDKYYYARNYKTWQAVGKGATEGIVSNAGVLSNMASSVLASPLQGGTANVTVGP